MIRAVLLAVLLVSALAPARAEAPLRVFAAASTADAVRPILEAFTDASGFAAQGVFAASSTLARQIAAGAPADLYLSADEAWMDWLTEQGGIAAESRRALLANRLVLIAPKARVPDPDFSLDAMKAALAGGRLALGDPDHVPAGRYAEAALRALGLWQGLMDRLAPARDVRAALAFVARGEAPLGIVYATDAAISDDVRVVAPLPDESQPDIRYPLAIVAGQESKAGVEALYRFFLSPQAAERFRAQGFTVLN